MKRLGTRYRMKWWRPLLGGIVLGVLVQGSATAQKPAQGAADAQEKIESLKSDYLNEHLQLSPEQAQKFWPVYRQYQQQMDALAQKRRENQISRNQMSHPSDAEVDRSLDRDFKLQQQALHLREQYRQKFRQVIPSQKVMQFYKSEKDFNMKLVRELRRRGDGAVAPSPARGSQGRAPVRSQPRQQPRSQPHSQPREQPRLRPRPPVRSQPRSPVRSTPMRNIRGGAAVHGGGHPQVRGR